jgi:hypothetical protein
MQDDASQQGVYQVAEDFQNALYASNLDVQLHSKHNMKNGELRLAENFVCVSIAQTFECFQRCVTKHRSTNHVRPV